MAKVNCGTLMSAHSRPSSFVIAKFINRKRGTEEVGPQSLERNWAAFADSRGQLVPGVSRQAKPQRDKNHYSKKSRPATSHFIERQFDKWLQLNLAEFLPRETLD